MGKRGIAAILVILFMVALIVAYVLFSYGQIKPDEGKICDGIKVDQIDIGGMTKEEAAQAVDSHIAKLGARTVQVDVNGKQAAATVSELGYTYAAGDYLEQAVNVGKNGNIIENYKEIRQAAQGKIHYSVSVSLNEEVLREFVNKNCGKLCTRAKNATVKMENGEFVYSDSREGVSIDEEATVRMIKEAVEAAADDAAIQITANVNVEQPAVSRETAAKCKDKVGTFSTTYNAGNVNRTKNLANAARLISGSVVYPGETFSVHDTISPLTEENGYYEAASYNNGKVEDSLGGGVCQVSTTLYNAVLRAELEIVERSPHSMVVSYVEPSMDAAIAGDYKDFKFKNNTAVPIYIQGGTYGSTIYFNIYGEETRSADRKVRYESEVTEEIKPGADKVTYDKTKPETYMKVDQEAHIGYKAKLWKIVMENGQEEKTQINSSTYSASPRYITKGSKKEPAATAKPDDSKKSKSEDKSDDTSGSDSTGSRSGRQSGGDGTGQNSTAATPVPQPTQAPPADGTAGNASPADGAGQIQ
ncbi:MAG: VanW family protein [Roseburia sp.]|nr:VanW family protein [Roseburia sp.]